MQSESCRAWLHARPAAGSSGIGPPLAAPTHSPTLTSTCCLSLPLPLPPPPQILGQLFDTNPNWIATDSLEGYPFAHSSTGTLYIADPPTVEQWMPQEWQLGTVTHWPDTICERAASGS